MDSIMQDKDEFNNRGLDSRLAAKYNQQDCKKIKFYIILAHLRKVVLQDAAALMELELDPACQYDLHHIFQHRVFKNPLFIQFRADLALKMRTATSPISDSLALNAPAIQHGLQHLSTQLTMLTDMLSSYPPSEMKRERELWSQVLGHQMSGMQRDLQTIHNGLVNVGNNASQDMKRLQQTLGQALSSAAIAVQSADFTS
ncbi:hypothetical protein BGZ82_004772, partial [Podila clonocystis]